MANGKGGFFILLSNARTDPPSMLESYVARAHIESIFKDGKSFLGLHPLAKWTDRRIRGKILEETIATIIRSRMLQKVVRHKCSLMDLFFETQILDCVRSDNDLEVSVANRNAREAHEAFGYVVSAVIDLDGWRSELMGRV